ncbi:MAG: hypothetical protein K0U78_15100 [Actinomycetia bacterium]|nr:hypothetical protein [Actinomycetes bacterium]
MVHSQKKGKRGEDEFCKWILENFNIKVRREHWQADGHSADIRIKDFLFEVKRRESLSLDNWWYQVAIAKKYDDKDIIPVVAFRQNRKKWEFLLPAKLIGLDTGYIRLSEKVFIKFAKRIVNEA